MSREKFKIIISICTSLVLFVNVSCTKKGPDLQENPQKFVEKKAEISPNKIHIEESLPEKVPDEISLIIPTGKTVEERFAVPKDFIRCEVEDHTFAAYLRGLSLKSHGSEVLYYDGRKKSNRQVYDAVVDMDIGTRDLQQCADAVIRLKAEYLYEQQLYDDIAFDFTNGFRVGYKKWMEGNRVAIEGNKTKWVKRTQPSNTYADFRKYLDIIFAYAGTISLSNELTSIPVEDMQIGDVFIQAGSPGHAVIVVDMAENPSTGEKLFMLAQSYMPAQDIQILKNPIEDKISPWYSLKFGEQLKTPEWTFRKNDLKRFPNS